MDERRGLDKIRGIIYGTYMYSRTGTLLEGTDGAYNKSELTM